MKKVKFMSAPMFSLLVLILLLTACDNRVDEQVKVISYNIRMSWNPQGDGINRWENRRDASVKMVLEEFPVVMGLQEACPDQLVFLDSKLEMYKRIGVGRDDGRSAGEAMAIYYDTTRVQLGRNGTFWLSETPDTVSKGWDAACNRTCTWGVFKIKDSGNEFVYFNTHFDHLGELARRNSVSLMCSRMAEFLEAGMPVVLSADFNTNTSDSIFEPLKAVMTEAREAVADADRLPTYNAFGVMPENDDNNNDKEENVIDHFFFSGIEANAFDVLRGDYGVPYISDHYPVRLMFSFNKR